MGGAGRRRGRSGSAWLRSRSLARESGWQVRGIIRGRPPRRTWTRSSRAPTPAGRRRERGEQLGRAQAQLLGDDRRVGLDDEVEALEPEDPAGAGRGRHALGDERLEGRHRPRQAQLVLEAEAAGRVGQQVAEPDHRPAAPAGSSGRSPAPADRAAAPVAASGADLPGRRRSATQRRVEVVERRRRHERLGQRRDPPDEVRPALRVELREDVVEQEERRPAVERGQEVELGELEGEDRRPLLAARREARRGRGRRARRRGRRGAARRASSRSRPPSRRSRRGAGRARPAATRRGVAGRSSRSASASRAAAASSGAISAWARGERPGEVVEQPQPLGDDRRRRRRGTSPSQKRSSSRTRLLLADRPEEAVPLLERPAVGREVARRRPASAGRELVERRPAERRRAGDRGASPRARRRPSGAGPTRPAARRGDAVDPDPLAAGRSRSRRPGRARPRRVSAPDRALDPGEVGRPSG